MSIDEKIKLYQSGDRTIVQLLNDMIIFFKRMQTTWIPGTEAEDKLSNFKLQLGRKQKTEILNMIHELEKEKKEIDGESIFNIEYVNKDNYFWFYEN